MAMGMVTMGMVMEIGLNSETLGIQLNSETLFCMHNTLLYLSHGDLEESWIKCAKSGGK